MDIMQIQHYAHNAQIAFGNQYKLSEKTIKMIERKTRLSYDEMKYLTFDDAAKLMRKRAPIGEKFQHEFKKIQLWFGNIYKNIGEKLGLLEKKYNIYTDIH